MYYKDGTFVPENNFCISLSNDVDCVYYNEKLVFAKYYDANGIFDLKDFYRIATDAEVSRFESIDTILIDESVEFDKKLLSIQKRKKIAKVLDLDTLDDIEKIKQGANDMDYEIKLTDDNKRIIFPSDNKEFDNLLAFLSEEMYPGVITGNKYLCNSTRKL